MHEKGEGMDTLDLFPETTDRAAPCVTEWRSALLDKWGHPRIEFRLISKWDEGSGWVCGWLVRLDGALDEWHPSAPNEYKRHGQYPWYRLDEMPRSGHFSLAAASAARAGKIVLEQMLAYANDEVCVQEARAISSQVEAQAMTWLIETP